MAISYGVERPTTGFGGAVQYTNPVLGDARLPEAEPEYTSFLPSAEEVRKRKLQDKMMVDDLQRSEQIQQLKALMKGPMETMGWGDLKLFDAMEPEGMVDMVNQFGRLGDSGVGLLDPNMLNDFAGSGFGGGFSGLNMGGSSMTGPPNLSGFTIPIPGPFGGSLPFNLGMLR